MSNAAPLAVWVGSMRPKTQRESLGGFLLLELSGPSRLLRKANASRLIDGERQLGPKRPAFHYYQCASIVVG